MKYSTRKSKRHLGILPALVLLFSFYNSFAQISTSSPYSRYGIGDIAAKGFSPNSSMGGACIGMQNDSVPMFFINNANPAAYPNIRLTTAELGATYNNVALQSSSTKKTVHSAGISYISLAFPIKKWWGSGIGLTPYSAVGYNISDHRDVSGIGPVDFLYEGSGSVDQLYWGNGFKPLFGLPKMFGKSKKYARLKDEKKFGEINKIMKRKRAWQGLSLGVNASYMFGNFQNTRRSIFDPAGLYFNTRTGTTTRFSDVYFDYGAQYSFTVDSLHGRDLKQNVKVTFGATFAPQTNINANIDSLSVNYFYGSLGNEIVRDTIEISENNSGSISFPLSFGFGASVKKGDRWLFAGDVAIQNWSNFKSFDKSQALQNSMRVSVGAQFVPNSFPKTGGLNYFKRVHYRMGVRYNQTALELKSTRLTEYGISAGLGFPLGRNYILQNFSMVNIGAEYGQRGTVSNGLIKENYVKVFIGFTLNDRWFVKPKFD